MSVLRQAVRHELEPQDPSACAHGGEAFRVQTLCRHVQAEGPPPQAPVLRAPERDIRRRGQQAGRRRRLQVQLLLLSHGLRVPAGADPSLVWAAQLPAVEQKPARRKRVILLPVCVSLIQSKYRDTQALAVHEGRGS